jgi:hypothetical protein
MRRRRRVPCSVTKATGTAVAEPPVGEIDVGAGLLMGVPASRIGCNRLWPSRLRVGEVDLRQLVG